MVFVLVLGNMCLAQDIVKKRTSLVWSLVQDLSNEVPFNKIYNTYLAEGDFFPDAARKKVGDDWSRGLRTTLNKVSLREVEVYQYVNNPDSARIKHQAGDIGEDYPEYRPLQFFLNIDNRHANLPVNLDDIYVIRLKSNGVLTYVLFDDRDQMITYGALQISNTVWLGKF